MIVIKDCKKFPCEKIKQVLKEYELIQVVADMVGYTCGNCNDCEG